MEVVEKEGHAVKNATITQETHDVQNDNINKEKVNENTATPQDVNREMSEDNTEEEVEEEEVEEEQEAEENNMSAEESEDEVETEEADVTKNISKKEESKVENEVKIKEIIDDPEQDVIEVKESTLPEQVKIRVSVLEPNTSQEQNEMKDSETNAKESENTENKEGKDESALEKQEEKQCTKDETEKSANILSQNMLEVLESENLVEGANLPNESEQRTQETKTEREDEPKAETQRELLQVASADGEIHQESIKNVIHEIISDIDRQMETAPDDVVAPLEDKENGTKVVDLQKIFTPATDAEEILPRQRKLYASSSFYSPTLHPTVEDQVELARRISHSLSDISNQHSKGQSMYVNRKKRSVKWVHEGEGKGLVLNTSNYEESRSEKTPLKFVMNPRGQVQDIETLRAQGVVVEPTAPSLDRCAEVVTALQAAGGKGKSQLAHNQRVSFLFLDIGAELFAKRRKRSEKWIVDESAYQTSMLTSEARLINEGPKTQPSVKMDQILKSSPPKCQLSVDLSRTEAANKSPPSSVQLSRELAYRPSVPQGWNAPRPYLSGECSRPVNSLSLTHTLEEDFYAVPVRALIDTFEQKTGIYTPPELPLSSYAPPPRAGVPHQRMNLPLSQYADLPKAPLNTQYADLPKAPLNTQYADLPKAPLNTQYADLPKAPLNTQYSDLPKAPMNTQYVFNELHHASKQRYVPPALESISATPPQCISSSTSPVPKWRNYNTAARGWRGAHVYKPVTFDQPSLPFTDF
ncbi:enolase-phosphatase E1 isoform X2 [Phlebotomus argentipes]|uniref:enolase-phosphatase E1 isoform X2 n=1 Tax=Phlebotomus argentipes TaxID=94469 RepID=UPI002892F841|nr:enolase-phosphatase E1 isoform X2 [Phlebotomus argentipes]